MATTFLRFCKAGSDGVAFGDGVSGVGYSSGVGKMYTWSVEGATGSGLLVGNGFKVSCWGSSTVSFPLPPPASSTGSSSGAYTCSCINSSRTCCRMLKSSSISLWNSIVQGALHYVNFMIGLDIHYPLLLYEIIH